MKECVVCVCVYICVCGRECTCERERERVRGQWIVWWQSVNVMRKREWSRATLLAEWNCVGERNGTG
jgi:hypothetical protein